jgi:hypothetical protein
MFQVSAFYNRLSYILRVRFREHNALHVFAIFKMIRDSYVCSLENVTFRITDATKQIEYWSHSFFSLSYDRSVALPKRVLPRVRPSASSFSFQYLPFSLRSSICCVSLLPRLPVTIL